MSLGLSICVLFVSLMESVNGAQFLNTTSLLLLSGFAIGSGAGAIAIVPLTTRCPSHLYNQVNLTLALKL